jgi:hypothetical protein
MANTVCRSITSRISGRNFSQTLPKASSATPSTDISMSRVNTSENTLDATRISRGKYTFFTRLALATSDPMEPPMLLARNAHGSRPQSRNSGRR